MATVISQVSIHCMLIDVQKGLLPDRKSRALLGACYCCRFSWHARFDQDLVSENSTSGIASVDVFRRS